MRSARTGVFFNAGRPKEDAEHAEKNPRLQPGQLKVLMAKSHKGIDPQKELSFGDHHY